MTKEEKQLLLTDLCSRLPYHVMVHYHHQYNENGKDVMYDEDRVFDYFEVCFIKCYCKPNSRMAFLMLSQIIFRR